MVCEIGAIAKAETVRHAAAMSHEDGLHFHAGHLNRSRIENIGSQAGTAGFGGRFVKHVLEYPADGDKSVGGSVDGDIVFLHEVERPYVVQAKDMIGVRMGIEDSVKPIDIETQGLIAKVGRRVDEDALITKGQEDGGTETLITRIRRGAHLAAATNHGDADAGAGAEHPNRGPLEILEHLLGLRSLPAVGCDDEWTIILAFGRSSGGGRVLLLERIGYLDEAKAQLG